MRDEQGAAPQTLPASGRRCWRVQEHSIWRESHLRINADIMKSHGITARDNALRTRTDRAPSKL